MTEDDTFRELSKVDITTMIDLYLARLRSTLRNMSDEQFFQQYGWTKDEYSNACGYNPVAREYLINSII